MTLDQVPAVTIEFAGCRKFVVAELIGPDSVTKIVVRAGDYYVHMDGYYSLMWELAKSEIGILRVLGGGSISADANIKAILMSGKSGQYGKEPDRQSTRRLVQEAYPDFKVEVED